MPDTGIDMDTRESQTHDTYAAFLETVVLEPAYSSFLKYLLTDNHAGSHANDALKGVIINIGDVVQEQTFYRLGQAHSLDSENGTGPTRTIPQGRQSFMI